MNEHPKITNDALFVVKVFELLREATTFKPSNETFLCKDQFFTVIDESGKWKVKVEFQENNSTWEGENH